MLPGVIAEYGQGLKALSAACKSHENPSEVRIFY